MSKNALIEKRQKALKDLLIKEALSDQETIVERLKSAYGIDTNQASVSRDLHELGVVKKDRNGKLQYELPTTDVSCEILKLAILDIVHNESMIVIFSMPGLAGFVGDFLDMQKDLEILGCIAGENTLFVVPKSVKTIDAACEQVKRALHFKKGT